RGYSRPVRGTGASCFEVVARTPEGLAEEVRFVTHVGAPAPDSRGVYGERNDYDDRGLLVRSVCLDQEGRATVSKQGYARAAATYAGAVQQGVSYFDAEDNPA